MRPPSSDPLVMGALDEERSHDWVTTFTPERVAERRAWLLARAATFTVRLEPDDTDCGWIAECPEVPGLMSQGETRLEAVLGLVDAWDAAVVEELKRWDFLAGDS